MTDSIQRSRTAALALALCTLATPSVAADDAPPLIPCTTTYALCTSAPCLPVPGDVEITVDGETGAAALCECDIVFGANVGVSSCDARDAGLLSTYSYAQTGALELHTCDDDFAPEFANCLDAPCEIDPRDPTRALCTCPLAPASAPWVTFGGDCDPLACRNVLWSGATTEDIGAANCVLNEYMNLDETGADADQKTCAGPYLACER